MTSTETSLEHLIAGLNEDLANEYASVIRYRTFASTVQGMHRLTLRRLFGAEVSDELSHAELLADSIAALGGTPTVRPASIDQAENPAEMLRHALGAEQAALARYVERRRQAEAIGEHGLAVAIDSIIADETRHRDELQLVLAGWTDFATMRAPTGQRGSAAEHVQRRFVRPADTSSSNGGREPSRQRAVAGGDTASGALVSPTRRRRHA